MDAIKDITGRRFGKIIAIQRIGKAKNKRESLWLVKCDCGNETAVRISDLTRGHTRSCGCTNGKAGGGTADGMAGTRTYRSYSHAKDRCTNPNDKDFRNYGGRGIRFLFTSFKQFFAELGECPPGFTLGRIDNDGPYAPGNCRWERRRPQGNNKRTNRPLTAFEVTHNLTTWARMLGIPSSTLRDRLKKMPPEQALASIKLKPGVMFEWVPVPASETYSKTDTWEFRPYAPGPAAIRNYRRQLFKDVWATMDKLPVRRSGMTVAAFLAPPSANKEDQHEIPPKAG